MLAINLDLRDKTVLLLGGGAVGRRKLAHIMRAGALVRVIEPAPDNYLLELAENKQIFLYAQYWPSLLNGVSLAFIATSDSEMNRRAAGEARVRGIWVNLAENPRDGDFFLPAVVGHGDFRLTVSTGGFSPALAAVAAERLRRDFGPEYGRLVALLAALRPLILASGLTGDERRAVFRQVAESEILLKALAAPGEAAALNLIKSLLPPALIDDGQLKAIISEAAAQA